MARAPKTPEPGRRKKTSADRAGADAAGPRKSGSDKSAPRSPQATPAGRARSPFPAPPRTQNLRADASARPPLARTPAPRAAPAERTRAAEPVRPPGRGRAASPSAPAAASPAPRGETLEPSNAVAGPGARIAAGLGLLMDLARVNLSGWSGILRAGLRLALSGFARVNLVQLLFAAACLSVFVTALARWLEYDITLLSLETVASGSRSRFWFILPALLGFLFVSVDLPFRRIVFYISTAAAGALYAAGFVFPDPIHTKMLKYEFTPWIYAYGAALAAAASLAGGGLSRALIEKEAIRSFLFSRPAD